MKKINYLLIASFCILLSFSVYAADPGKTIAVAGTLATIGLGNPFKADAFGAEWGFNDEAYLVRATWQWNREEVLWRWGKWTLRSYIELDIGQWKSLTSDTQPVITEVGVTPVFRYSRYFETLKTYFYLDFASGPHWLSQVVMNERRFSTPLQFGDMFGVGIKCQWLNLGYRFQHISNGDIKLPNNGINFHLFQTNVVYEF